MLNYDNLVICIICLVPFLNTHAVANESRIINVPEAMSCGTVTNHVCPVQEMLHLLAAAAIEHIATVIDHDFQPLIIFVVVVKHRAPVG